METPVPTVLDLDCTPLPSPPSKKPKLPPITPKLRTFLDPCNQKKKQAPEPPEATQLNNDDLPEDFLEPLDTNGKQITGTFSSQDSDPLPVPPLPPGSSPFNTHIQQSLGAISPSLDLTHQNVCSIPASSSPTTTCALYSTFATPMSLPVQKLHLRGALRPLQSSTSPFQCMNNSTSLPHSEEVPVTTIRDTSNQRRGCTQFWKAGDYDGDRSTASSKFTQGGMDHVRVHPKFLHSNATSHKWALGAVAELLDNALDEVSNGSTFVNVDMVHNPEDGGPMLCLEDDGGGMDPDCLRQCMSLGYSAKSKRANTIGQYGNGFKTSTMRLGSDVLVFTRRPAKSGGSPTQSIGMLSYSFLRDTNQEDIIVPMIDYEIKPFGLQKLVRSTAGDWNCNMDTITKWSPYHTESGLLDQFQSMKHQGTKIIIYNLWEDEEGQLELDFEEDTDDIQVRGANRDQKKIAMGAQYPNSRHYLTYRHSLRSYASILYLRLPDGFHIILRGKEVEHHPLVNDMMFTQQHTYKPHSGGNAVLKEANMMAIVTIGFVKDAKEHVDVQGFSVYHKNRLIKPFWRIWNAASSQGRGIIAVLEANFVEPAHDKQGFERTVVLGRLESRLLQMQKAYWKEFSHRIGYAKKDTPRVHYPARGMVRLEAPLHRVVTRGIASMHDSLEALSPQDDCAQSGVPNSNKEGTCTDDSTSIHAKPREDEGYIEADGLPDSTRALRLRDGNAPSASNRIDTDTERPKLEIEENEQQQLRSKVFKLEKTVDILKESITEVMKERDNFKLQLERTRRQFVEEQDLRFQLKAAYLRIQRLEGERNGVR